jgi:predicted small integral membrane protein
MELMICTSILTWMEWTVPTAIFFIVIFLILVAMTIWQTLAPSVERRGFLPIPTTPGDRLFIGLLGTGYIFLAWVGLTNLSLWFMLAIGVCWMFVVMRWG